MVRGLEEKQVHTLGYVALQFAAKGGSCNAAAEYLEPKLNTEGMMLMFLYASTGIDAFSFALSEGEGRRGNRYANLIGRYRTTLGAIRTRGLAGRAVDSGLRCKLGCTAEDPKLRSLSSFIILNSPSLRGGKADPFGVPGQDSGYTQPQLWTRSWRSPM